MNKTITPKLGMTLQGKCKTAVVDAITGEEIWRSPNWKKNLILNQGLDRVPTTHMAGLMTYGIAGTGTRLNDISGGDSNGSVAGGYFMLDPIGSGILDLNSTTYGGWVGGVLSSGDILQFGDSTEVSVTAVGDLSASVSYGGTVSTQSFTIWKTSQTALQSETKRGGFGITNSSYLTGEGNCGTTVTAASGLVQHRRTYDFSSESIDITYTEVGTSWATTGAGTTFNRIVLDTPISLSMDQRLRLVYELEVTYSPTGSVYVSNAPISGWPVLPATNTNITQSLQGSFTYGISRVYAENGFTDNNYTAMEVPAGVFTTEFFGSSESGSLQPLGSAPLNRSQNVVVTTFTPGSYVNGSYTQTKSGTFDLNSLNLTILRSFGFGSSNSPGVRGYLPAGNVFCMLFDQNQTKTNVQTLTMTFQWTWGRTLS